MCSNLPTWESGATGTSLGKSEGDAAQNICFTCANFITYYRTILCHRCGSDVIYGQKEALCGRRIERRFRLRTRARRGTQDVNQGRYAHRTSTESCPAHGIVASKQRPAMIVIGTKVRHFRKRMSVIRLPAARFSIGACESRRDQKGRDAKRGYPCCNRESNQFLQMYTGANIVLRKGISVARAEDTRRIKGTTDPYGSGLGPG